MIADFPANPERAHPMKFTFLAAMPAVAALSFAPCDAWADRHRKQ
jgi:hypothetical protein